MVDCKMWVGKSQGIANRHATLPDSFLHYPLYATDVEEHSLCDDNVTTTSAVEENALDEDDSDADDYGRWQPANKTMMDNNQTEEDVATKYIIKIREENKLTQKCTRQIAHVTELYIRQSLHNLKRKIDECLAGEGIDIQEISGYEDAFSGSLPSFETLSSDLVTHHREGKVQLPYVVIFYYYFKLIITPWLEV